MPDEQPEPTTPEAQNRKRLEKIVDNARNVLADDTLSEDCKEIAREILRQAGVAYS